MRVKERIKKRLDALPAEDVRAVSVLLDKIEEKNRLKKTTPIPQTDKPYKKVADLLQKNPITSEEIKNLRADRI
jgi:hypothetical protein